MSLRLTVGYLTIHRIIEQEVTFADGARHASRADAGAAGGEPRLDAEAAALDASGRAASCASSPTS